MHAPTHRTLAPILVSLAFAAACSSGAHTDITAEPSATELVSGDVGTGAVPIPSIPTKTLGVVKGASCSFSKIATLAGSVCAVLSGAAGKVACWGDNGSGQLGDGTTSNRNYPAEVLTFAGTPFSGAVDVTGISNPGYTDRTACALKSDGTVWCWGGNANGSLGAKLASGGATNTVALPVQVQDSSGANLTGVTKIFGGFGLCALKSNGTLWCWGGNGIADGIAVGDQSVAGQRNEAHQIIVSGGAPLSNVTSAWLTRDMGCALKTDKTAWCWGGAPSFTCVSASSSLYAGQLNTPSVLNDLTQVTAGSGHFCATRNGGTARCWGGDWNPTAQLGDNTASGTPGGSAKCNAVDVLTTGPSTLTGVTKVSSGGSNNCALKSDGRVYCWGANDRGAIGDGTTTARNVATKVLLAGGADFTGATDISVADSAACALKADGSAWCWGAGGQAGDGDPADEDNLNPAKVQCRECDTNVDCGGATPACDTATSTCVACVDNTTCNTAGLRACDRNTQQCVECVDDSTCTTGNLRHCGHQRAEMCRMRWRRRLQRSGSTLLRWRPPALCPLLQRQPLPRSRGQGAPSLHLFGRLEGAPGVRGVRGKLEHPVAVDLCSERPGLRDLWQRGGNVPRPVHGSLRIGGKQRLQFKRPHLHPVR